MWTDFVDLVYMTLLSVSTALGGSMGWAIAVVSFAVRLVLLPITLRMAYRGLEVQAAIGRLAPLLKGIREKHKKDQHRIAQETAALYQANGIQIVSGGSLATLALQTPVFVALFEAIRRGLANGGRFLWVRDLGVPDGLLALGCATVTAWSSALAPNLPESQRAPAIVIPALLTLLFLSRMAAGISIYSLSSGVVGLVQAVLVRKRARQVIAA
jgi:YidC/Oxa1 family membrane protein insertase